MWAPSPLPKAPPVSQELQLREAQNENARLVEENSRLSGRATEKEQVAALPIAMGLGLLLEPWSPGKGDQGSSPGPLSHHTGLECEGHCPLGEGAAGTRLTHLAPCPFSRWSGRMQS